MLERGPDGDGGFADGGYFAAGFSCRDFEFSCSFEFLHLREEKLAHLADFGGVRVFVRAGQMFLNPRDGTLMPFPLWRPGRCRSMVFHGVVG